MSRRSFRSQPSLQRSGGWRPSSALLGLGGLAVMAVSFGAVVSALQDGPAVGDRSYGVAGLEETAAASAQASAPAPQDQAAAQAEPPLLTVPPPQLVAASAPVAARTLAKPRAPRAAKPPAAPPAAEPTPQQAWEQQRQDYARAVEAYEAQEKAEGYRWAQANRIRLNRYCRAAERRTPAFLQGCLNFVRSESGGGAERAGAGAGRAGEPG